MVLKRVTVRRACIFGLSLLLLTTVAGAAGEYTGFVTGPMSTVRQLHAAVALQDGSVLVVGGATGSGYLRTAETFAHGLFSPVSSLMTVARLEPAAVTLADGRVLVSGGATDGGVMSNTVDIYDPATRVLQPNGTVTGTTAFPGNIIPAIRIHPIATVAFKDFYPLANRSLTTYTQNYTPELQIKSR